MNGKPKGARIMGSIVRLSLKENDYIPEERKVTKIEAWYDRHTRDWCIELLDDNGYAVGDCVRVVGKAEKNWVVSNMMSEYGIKA